MKVNQLLLASLAVFYIIHLFAKPQPQTMSKEWQEATNEYAKVCSCLSLFIFPFLRPSRWDQSLTGVTTA